MDKSIAFIGCGHMAGAVAKALYNKFPHFNFLTYTPSKTKAINLANEIKGKVLDIDNLKNSNRHIEDVDIFIIGCKPQQYKEFASQFKNLISKDAIIVSLLAATPIEIFKNDFPNAIIRFMPNIPIAFNEGVSLIYTEEKNTCVKECLEILAQISTNFTLTHESDLEKLTVISSSGPAYFLEIAKNFANSLEIESLSENQKNELVLLTMKGAALMPSHMGKSTGDLIDSVTSKGGVTIEALTEYRSQNLAGLIKAGVIRAHKRALEIINSIHKQS